MYLVSFCRGTIFHSQIRSQRANRNLQETAGKPHRLLVTRQKHLLRAPPWTSNVSWHQGPGPAWLSCLWKTSSQSSISSWGRHEVTSCADNLFLSVILPMLTASCVMSILRWSVCRPAWRLGGLYQIRWH
jgi:hypothetical protein